MWPFIEISPLLEWAIAIIGWAVEWIGFFCVMAFGAVIVSGFLDQIADLTKRWLKAIRNKRKGRYRT